MTPQPAKKKKRRQEKIPAYLSEGEIKRLFHVIKSARDRALFSVIYYRGLRASEVGMIEMGDYREDCGRLTIRRLKGSRGGEYPLTHAEKVSLGAWLRERGKEPGPMFPSRQGRRGLSRKMLHELMRHYCKLAGIDPSKAHCHALKHSCGTHLSAIDPDIVSIQDHLGHACISNTMKYIQISSKRREDFIKRTDRSGWGRITR